MTSNTHNWAHVPLGPPDPILSLTDLFLKDNNPLKVNLGVGAYRDENGKPYILPSIKMAEEERHNEHHGRFKKSHEYLPISGNPEFVSNAIKFAYGDTIFNNYPIAACQTISGTGAIRVAAEFLYKYYKASVFIPQPSWPIHYKLFTSMKFEVFYYRYWDNTTLGLDMNGLIADMMTAPEKSIFIIHTCAHNPTGCDPTKEQWKEIEKVFKSKNHFPLFDMAYQGFATGNPDEDAWPVRYFVEKGHPVLLCQSFAKNMGLYGQRVGTISIVCKNSKEQEACLSQLKSLIRLLYSSPPRFGSELAANVFNNFELFQQFKHDIVEMSSRIREMRETLYQLLRKHNIFWDHILNQKGMFAYTGLSEFQVQKLMNEYHIYMTKDGRISIPGLNSSNIQYVSDSIAYVINTKVQIPYSKS